MAGSSSSQPPGCRVRRRRCAVLAAAALAPVLVADAFVAPGAPRALRRQAPLPGRTALHGWSLFHWGADEEVDEKGRDRFLSFADGEGEETRLPRESLRSLLECTDSFCLTKHWLAESTLDKIWKQYAAEDGIGIKEFGRLAHDGLLLEGKLEEYEKAFSGVDEGDGLISRETLGKLFAGLGKHFSAEELDQIVDEADVGHDGIDFADFLGLARTHLELAEVVRYLETTPKRVQASDEAADGMLGHITTVHSEAELDAIVASGKDVVVKLAFTWCRPCKAFLPRYEKYAKVYKDTTFLKIVGNENESCKHYAKEVLRARISPMFAVYSEGQLLTTWNGANNQRFMDKMEEFLPSARQLIQEREAAIAADPTLAPAVPTR